MARNERSLRHSKYVIRIVCEGDKTEPLFFTSLCSLYFKDDETIDVRTIPQPRIQDEDEEEKAALRGCYRGKKRKVGTLGNDISDDAIIGVPPLKWVLYARRILSEGVDEAWAVYDKDEHPMHEEAFAEAGREIDGKKVNIAFSSRSFEYYLLLHFEYVYRDFRETECGERKRGKKLIYECGTGKFPGKDCCGHRCINGYARKRGYWKETKSSISTFPLVKDRLIKGMVNACRLRAESDEKTSGPIYQRNPYTNADVLVGRLIGKETVSYGKMFTYCEHGSDWSVRICDDGLMIKNNNQKTEIFSKGKIVVYDWESGESEELNDKGIMLPPDENILLPCNLGPNQLISIKISSEKEVLLLTF